MNTRGDMFNFDVNALVEKMQPAVEALASSLSVKADQLWTLGVQVEQVKGAFALGVALCAFVGLCLIPKSFRASNAWSRQRRKPRETYDIWTEERAAWAWVPFFAQILVCSATFLGCLYYGLIHVLVPQYALIMEILFRIQNH